MAFGSYGLKAAECGWITTRQIEAARIAMTRFVKRGGKIWIRIFPISPLPRSRPRPEWVPEKELPRTGWRSLNPGRILYEMEGVDESVAREAFRLASHKIAIPTKFIKRA